jgi:ATP-dependent RNA helicase DDX47/RRP3
VTNKNKVRNDKMNLNKNYPKHFRAQDEGSTLLPKHTPTNAKSEQTLSVGGGMVTFQSLGLAPVLCESIKSLKWEVPTEIQKQSIPFALQGKDMIGLAETGSGKTGAFCLPILHALLRNPRRLFGLIITPTRELALQIGEQIEALGGSAGVCVAVLVGGVDLLEQSVALAKKPHIIVATPGRLVDHLENTKGFSLHALGVLVLDEADRMLSMDFEEEINRILEIIPSDGRQTSLFSATMTSKVNKLQRASLVHPVKIEISSVYKTVSTLVQQYIFMPAKFKDCYFVYVVNEFVGRSMIVFASTHNHVKMTTLLLKNLGFSVTCLHGGMSQQHRTSALNKFKCGDRKILVATDVASRGLDIPCVDIVINLDVPDRGKEYIHRVGRTARAGRHGRAVTCVTQYDVEKYQRIESLLGKKLDAFPVSKKLAMVLLERVCDAQKRAASQFREDQQLRSSKRKRVGGRQKPPRKKEKRL